MVHSFFFFCDSPNFPRFGVLCSSGNFASNHLICALKMSRTISTFRNNKHFEYFVCFPLILYHFYHPQSKIETKTNHLFELIFGSIQVIFFEIQKGVQCGLNCNFIILQILYYDTRKCWCPTMKWYENICECFERTVCLFLAHFYKLMKIDMSLQKLKKSLFYFIRHQYFPGVTMQPSLSHFNFIKIWFAEPVHFLRLKNAEHSFEFPVPMCFFTLMVKNWFFWEYKIEFLFFGVIYKTQYFTP